MRRWVVGSAAVAGLAAVAISVVSSTAGPSVAADQPVLVLRHAVRGGSAIDPADLVVVRLPRRLIPAGALVSADQAAYRAAAVSLPAGLPLVGSFLRDPGLTAGLRRGERAVGVRVDDVTGLPQLLVPGARVDVLVRGVLQIADAQVVDRPRRNGDGVSWSVALRLPAAVAARLGRAQARGDEIRLLPRGGAP